MTRNMLTLRAAPLMSAIFMRHEVTREEKEQILSSVESEPGVQNSDPDSGRQIAAWRRPAGHGAAL